MNRRAFLATLAAAFALDPERALWVPGRKLISIPAPRVYTAGPPWIVGEAFFEKLGFDFYPDYAPFAFKFDEIVPCVRVP